jgi:transposase
MQFVGIDMSKADFHASFDDSGKSEVFANAPDGYRGLLRRLAARGFAKEDATVGTEATGTYHLPLAAFLASEGWRVAVINPIITSRLAKSKVRSAKTDRIDAGVVRRAAAQGDGRLFTETPGTMEMKSLASQRAALVATRGDYRRRIEARTQRDRASGVRPHDAYENVVAAVSDEIKRIDALLAGLAKEAQALLRSIPGVGPATSAALVATVGDVRRFDHPKKLVAYVGLDCRVHESGSSVRGKGYLTKKGDGRLRHALFMSAFVASRRIPELAAYYAKKRAEGMHHTAVLCAVERKLVHIIWAVWTRGTPFVQKEAPAK